MRRTVIVHYDAETKNGIPYITALYDGNFRYKSVVTDLDNMWGAKQTATSGGQYKSYTIGDRSVTRSAMTPDRVLSLWDKLMAEKERLEQGRSKRRTLGVIPRDW